MVVRLDYQNRMCSRPAFLSLGNRGAFPMDSEGAEEPDGVAGGWLACGDPHVEMLLYASVLASFARMKHDMTCM